MTREIHTRQHNSTQRHDTQEASQTVMNSATEKPLMVALKCKVSILFLYKYIRGGQCLHAVLCSIMHPWYNAQRCSETFGLQALPVDNNQNPNILQQH